MGVFRSARNALRNTELLRTRFTEPPPRGVDVLFDLQRSLPQLHLDMIFDVGANVGQSADYYTRRLPKATVYCFEPVCQTFRELESHFGSNHRVQCFPFALGSAEKQGTMLTNNTSTENRLIEGMPTEMSQTETVSVITLESFCRSNEVQQINYLKIDTEGADLDVLKGAHSMLADQKVDVVEVEAGMNPENSRHVQFEVLKQHLEAYSYRLFGLYEQCLEWPTREPHMRRANCVFISHNTIEQHRGLS